MSGTKVNIHYTDWFADTVRRLREDGLLLCTVDTSGKPNVMTIGWATFGSIWGRPVCVVLVRPSRFSYGYLEATGEFTVNVPPKELAMAVALCGKVSGRDYDKFRQANLTPVPARSVKAPIIQECVIHYECKTIHSTDVRPESFPQAILNEYYPSGDFHRIYFGEIVEAYADPDAADRLRSQPPGLSVMP